MNAGVEQLRYSMGMLNDEEFMRRDGLSLVTPDFVRYDRRRLTVEPTQDRDAWLESIIGLGEAAGSWPTFSVPEVLAVRGERLAAYRLMVRFDDGSELEQLAVSQSDEAAERGEIFIMFNSEDVDLAIAELDRLHDELTHG